MRIGIFGGTFNPPHNTHVAMAREAVRQLGLDKLTVIPCGIPPHKFCDLDAATRLRLAHLAFDDFAEVSDYEIAKGGTSYTVETLGHFRKLYPQAEMYLIIGGDSFTNFDKWYRPDEIASLARLAVADRNRQTSVATMRRITSKFNADVTFLHFEPTNASSTEIRLRYEFGMDNVDAVPQAVDDYILNNGLYSSHRAMAEKLRQYLTPERFMHTFYVVKRGLELATDNRDKAFVACLLHDVAKYIPKSDYAEYSFEQGDLPDSVVHSFLGAKVAQRDFGVNDAEILDAIAYHTTGRPNMTQLDKLVYVADKTEDSRPYPTSHLKKGSLDDQFAACLAEAYRICLERHHDSLCPLSEQTLAYYSTDKRTRA